MAHFPQIPTVGRRPLSTVTLRNLRQVCGSGHAGNVKHALLWHAIWCKFRGVYFPLLICWPLYAHTDGHFGPITVCLVERRASVPPLECQSIWNMPPSVLVHCTFTELSPHISGPWAIIATQLRYPTPPLFYYYCSISSHLIWCDNKVDALKCKPGYSEALKTLIRNVSR